MAHYRLYLLDPRFKAVAPLDLHCDHDEAACERAKELYPRSAWELWRDEDQIHCHAGPFAPSETEQAA